MTRDFERIDKNLDEDQRKILYILSLYASEDQESFLQYTAWLVIVYYLMNKGLFPNYRKELLLYYYNNLRRYLWEDKKFMQDVNVLRYQILVIRARTSSRDYKNINSHQCTKFGQEYLNAKQIEQTDDGKKILKELICKKCGKQRKGKSKRVYEVIFEDEQPILKCLKCENTIIVEGFLRNLSEPIGFKQRPSILSINYD